MIETHRLKNVIIFIQTNKVVIKRFAWEFNLYWKFMYADKNKTKNNKTNLAPPPPSTPVTVSLIVEKLLSLWL